MAAETRMGFKFPNQIPLRGMLEEHNKGVGTPLNADQVRKINYTIASAFAGQFVDQSYLRITISMAVDNARWSLKHEDSTFVKEKIRQALSECAVYPANASRPNSEPMGFKFPDQIPLCGLLADRNKGVGTLLNADQVRKINYKIASVFAEQFVDQSYLRFTISKEVDNAGWSLRHEDSTFVKEKIMQALSECAVYPASASWLNSEPICG